MADDARLVTDRRRQLFDPDAERAVLGAVMLDVEGRERVLPRLAAIVTEADFYDPRHALFWEAFLAIHRRRDPIDVHTVVAELRVRDRLNTVGGAQYVGELTDLIPTMAHCEAHARIVQRLAASRRALEAFGAAGTRLAAGDPLEAVQSELQRTLQGSAAAAEAARVGKDLEALNARILARMEKDERPLATPWANVDQLLGGGLWPGMYVLVGGTGAGKTQWAIQFATTVAQAGQRVLYLALELSREDIAVRVVSSLAGLSWSAVLRGQINDGQHRQYSEACKVTAGLPLHTECGVPFGYGADTLAARAWSLKPALVVVDYLQVCANKVGEDPRISVGRVSYVARSIARDLGAVVLVLSSTARENYAKLVNDPDCDPGDLVGLGKESGEIEYAADGVMVLARDGTDKTRRVLIVAKNRYGELGRAELAWSGTAFQVAPGEEGGEVL